MRTVFRFTPAAAVLSMSLNVALIPVSSAEVSLTSGDHRIDVAIDGVRVTSYLYRPDITKPVLYPLTTPSEIIITRGFPFETVEGETQDHPHHTGLFFTVDEVNGNKFWGNTKGLPRIIHAETLAMTGGKTGVLSVRMNWVGGDSVPLLEEHRAMEFLPGANEYAIDFSIRLKALADTVVFGDTKEGMFAIRTADWLRENGGTGQYLASNGGATAADIWGRRSLWVRLEGSRDGRTAGAAILHHPASVNHPTFWHARDYGLFSANPLGQSVFEAGTGVKDPKPFRLTLAKGEEALFRFLVIVYDGSKTAEEMQRAFDGYARKK